ncbi:MAG: Flp family type IVb pilin [Rhodomicrobiaceae bacterium]
MRISPFALVKRFIREERGASMVEYAILVGLVTAAIVATIGLMSGQINTIFTNVNTALTGAATGTAPE